MFLLKILLGLFVLCGSEIIFAFAERLCFDCVSIGSCQSGLDFARRLHQGSLPSGSIQTFRYAVCGQDPHDPRIPKVCCSDFPMNEPTSKIPPRTTTTTRTTTKTRTRTTTTTTIRPTLKIRVGVDNIDPVENHQNIGLLPTSCGDIDGKRIVGGSVANLYEFPWMALISYRTYGGLDFQCAGSVINSRYILTAAHCVIQWGKLLDIAGVRIGDFDYRKKYDCQGPLDDMICESYYQDIQVEKRIPHERFRDYKQENDIALLRLSETIKMTINAAPICLPLYSELRNAQLSGKNGTVAGWGVTENRTSSSELRKVVIPIRSGDACSHYYNRAEHQRTSILDKVFCAGTQEKDTCNGDSGGPLMMESDFDGSIRIVQFGIVSFGPNKCASEKPGLYTDVTKYMEWILDNISA